MKLTNMKDYWTQKIEDGNSISIDADTILHEYDRKAAKFEAARNEFKPGYTVKYTGSVYNRIKNKIGVVKYVTINNVGYARVAVKYEGDNYVHFLPPEDTIVMDEDVSVINSKKQIKSEFSIKKVIFNNPATIVFWDDDTKTVVKCGKRDTFDCEKGVAMAIAKKALGNTKDYYKEIKKFLPKEEERKKSLVSDEGLINLMLKVFGVVDEDYS